MTALCVYTTAPGVPVAAAFARGFEARHGGDDPLRRAATQVLTNTPRSRTLIEQALAAAAPGATLLPRIRLLTEIGGDPLDAPDLPPAIEPLRRHLRLVRLVEAYLARDRQAGAPLSAAPALAEALAGLMDECDEAGLDPDALDGAVAEDQAAHWQRTLSFVDLVRRNWPDIRAESEGGALDPKDRQRRAVDALIAGWEAAPPEAPVIAAGSTGAVASTGRLMAAIARLPEGTVVLPGLDRELPGDVWARIRDGEAPEHPQAPFARVLTALGLSPAEVAPWEDAPPSPRRRLATEALRPAPVSDAWQSALPGLAPGTEAACEGLTLVEADSPRAEAGAVALAIRRALAEPETQVALVTPDAGLARRVTAELARFDVTPDDSLGRPLAQTPPAVFLRLVLSVAVDGAEAARLAALLQHPMCRAGHARRRHLAHARAYEIAALRRPLAMPLPGALPPWPEPRPERGERWPEPGPERLAWLGAIEAAIAPLAEAVRRGAPLSELVAAHRAAAEALNRDGPEEAETPQSPLIDEEDTPSPHGETPGPGPAKGRDREAGAAETAASPARTGPTGDAAEDGEDDAPETPPDAPEEGLELWQGQAGETLKALFEKLRAHADAHGDAPMPGYPALLQTLLAGEEVRPDPAAPHPRVAILGPREARTQPADLVILAGLNDGTWPALPGADPWLSRPMRARLGLPAPETRIGLSAHDFLHALMRTQVILTRATRAGGAPTVASRWLTRLETLLGGIDDGAALEAMRARGRELTALLPHLHGPGAAIPPARRPLPRPDPLARPRRLSVTEVETLIRDAYAIYARRVLGLRPLDPPGRAHDARDRGTVLHAVLQRYVEETNAPLSDPAAERARLLAIAEEVLAREIDAPDLRRIWQARLARAADWFVTGEIARRAADRPLALEVKGEMQFETAGGPFTLSAKADRIDLRPDGQAVIYDYKTGAPPSAKSIADGFAQQIHLQALILAAGGFRDGEGVPLAACETAAGAYLGLTGSGAGGRETLADDIAPELASWRERLLSLIAAYDLAETAYLPRGRPKLLRGEGDYDHLSRRDEWEGEE